jgi:hypothetical protein
MLIAVTPTPRRLNASTVKELAIAVGMGAKVIRGNTRVRTAQSPKLSCPSYYIPRAWVSTLSIFGRDCPDTESREEVETKNMTARG